MYLIKNSADFKIATSKNLITLKKRLHILQKCWWIFVFIHYQEPSAYEIACDDVKAFWVLFDLHPKARYNQTYLRAQHQDLFSSKHKFQKYCIYQILGSCTRESVP